MLAAYAAGYMDADGCLCIKKQRDRFQAYANASSVNEDVLEQLASEYGGNVTGYNWAPRALEYLTVYHWYLSETVPLREFLIKIEPLLILKRRQAQIILKFLENRGNYSRYHPIPESEHQKRAQLFAQMRELNRVGAVH